jgi:hypothetical protein
VVEFHLELKLILRIISYLTYMCWEIDNFVIKSDIFRRFFICKNILKKLSCYHDNNSRYFMFGKYNGFVSMQGEGFCVHVFSSIVIIRCDIIRASVPRCRILPRKCPAGYLTFFCRRFLIGEIEFSLGFADCVSSRGSETRSALRRLPLYVYSHYL